MKFEAWYHSGDRFWVYPSTCPRDHREGGEISSIKGRPLLIYTDGLNEAENKDRQLLGDDRLLEILRKTDYHDPRQLIESLTAEVEKHRDGAEPNDDLTMMVICLK